MLPWICLEIHQNLRPLCLLLCFLFEFCRLFFRTGQSDGTSDFQHQQHDRTGALHPPRSPLAAPWCKAYSLSEDSRLTCCFLPPIIPHIMCSNQPVRCPRRRSMHYKHTHLRSSFVSPFTYTLERTPQTDFQHCVHFRHQLAKNTERFRAPPTVSRVEKHQNCSKGTKQAHCHTSNV